VLTALVAQACGSSQLAGHRGSQPPLPPFEQHAGLRAIWGGTMRPGPPLGVLLFIHGGGWKGPDTAALQQDVTLSVGYRRLGFDTLSVDYRSGARGLDDVDAFYRDARGRVGHHVPVCAIGSSAGGNLALLLAQDEPSLTCLIDIAGPTDLPALKPLAASYQIALTAFGLGRLRDFSPALRADPLSARALLVYAQDDPIVPVSQGREMARADPSARLIVLPPGNAPFVHNDAAEASRGDGVTTSAKLGAETAEIDFLLRAARTSHRTR
jgi:acetyl esterase/lipase